MTSSHYFVLAVELNKDFEMRKDKKRKEFKFTFTSKTTWQWTYLSNIEERVDAEVTESSQEQSFCDVFAKERSHLAEDDIARSSQLYCSMCHG